MNRIGLALGAGLLGAVLLVGCTDDNGDNDLGLDGGTGTNGGASSPLDNNGNDNGDNGDNGTATATDGETVEASIEEGALEDQEIEVGDTIVWTNEDDVARTIASDDGSIESGEIPPGGTFEHTFTQRGLWMLMVDGDSTELAEVNVTD